MPDRSSLSRVAIGSLVTIVVVAIVVVAASRGSMSDMPAQVRAAGEAQGTDGHTAPTSSPQVVIPTDPDPPQQDTPQEKKKAPSHQEAAQAKRGVPAQSNESEAAQADDGGRDPVRQLSRQYARRAAAKSKDRAAATTTPPPANEIHEPVLAFTQDHRESCLVFLGDSIPAGTLPDAGGKEHALLASLGKKLTVVVLWNADNPYAFDQFQEMQTELVPLCDQGVQVVAIHVGASPPDYAQLCTDSGAGALCLLDADQKYFAQLARRKLPRTYVLNAEGKILWLDLEYSRATRYDLRNALHYYLQKPSR
jgi:peroxiredoxin